MALRIWTSAESDALTRTFGKALKSMRPTVPPHDFIKWGENDPVPVILPNDVLVVSGTKALSSLQKAGVVPKGRTVVALREKLFRLPIGHAMVTYDPGVISSEPQHLQMLAWDLQLAARFMNTGSLKPVIGTYKWVNSFADTIAWVEAEYEKTGEPVDVAADTETMGFYPWYPDKDIVSLSITAEPETAHVLYTGPQQPPIPYDEGVDLFAQIEWLFTSPKVKMRGANLKYDLIWIREKWEIICTNFKFDSMLVGGLLDENRSNSLNTHAKVATTMGGYDDDFSSKYDKGKMETIPAGDDLLTYAGGDTDACQRASNVFRDDLIEDPKLAQFYINVLHPAARAFENVETRGVVVDEQKMAILREDLDATINEGYKKAVELLPYKMQVKFRERIAEQLADSKSPMLPSILQAYFFSPEGLNLKPKMTTAKGTPSTAKAHLKMFADVPACVDMVEALTQADVAMKTRSTFVDGFLKHLRPDGLLHPTYFLVKGEYEGFEDEDSGTDTGRLSAKNPPFQIIPKKTKWAKRIRECYPAPKGKVVVQLDYSQGELRVVACVANEKNMIAAYEAGMDLHALTGSRLAQVPYEEFSLWKDSEDEKLAKLFEDLRSRAKAGNFGLLYGMGVEGFQAYAWANYGLKLSYADAEAIRNAFFEAYPGLTAYHDNQRKFVRLHEMVRSPLGRVAHLPTIRSWDREIKSKAERKAINSPIQSTLSDMMIWSIAEMEDAYPNDEIAIVGMIHDAMIAYVDEDKVKLRCQQAQEIMSNLPLHKVGWDPQLKFPADAEAGPNLASLKKLSLWA